MKTPFRIISKSLLAAAIAALVVACSEDEQGPAPLTPPDLSAVCQQLQVPGNLELVAHTFATGVQIYRWDSTSTAWVFVSPSATLFADAGLKHAVGMHYSGPTWEGLDGSEVVGSAPTSCTPNTNAIPWLLLNGASTSDAGEFQGVTRIQRVNTTGGKAPANAGNPNQIVSVPYTTEYYFYAPQ